MTIAHNLKWFGGITTEEREDFGELLINSQKVLDKLDEICYNMCIERERSIQDDYDSPSWAYKQADYIGFKRALDQVRLLLKQQNQP